MQIKLPVPYHIEARINRSRTGRTEQLLACSYETFEIRSEPTSDVHLVAEWQQKWNHDNRDDWKPETTGNWLTDFKSDSNLSRLIVINGEFYSPLKAKIDSDIWQPYTTKHFTANNIRETRNILARELGGLHQNNYISRMNEGQFWPVTDHEQRTMPDLTGRTEISNDLDKMKRWIKRKLDDFILIDDVVFRAVPEPVIGVFSTKDWLTMKITERRDSANSYTTSYFSLTDFQSALDHYQTCLETGPERPASLEITDLTVYLPAAFTMEIENAELLKTATQLLENTEKLVSKMPAEIAAMWFKVRDAYANASAINSEAELTHLSQSITNLHDGVMLHGSASEQLKEACSIGAPAGQRWETRPITLERSPAR
jgi:hypothetical protein